MLPQERENNPSEVNDKLEAELDQPHDEAASQASHREEEMIPIRPQWNKRPPTWLSDFVTGGELEQSLSIHPEVSTQAVQIVKMAQPQLEYPPALRLKIYSTCLTTKNGENGDYQVKG